MRMHISPNSGVPIYAQIIAQIKMLVGSGRLQPGDELPAIRTLAEELVINPNTVARAYRDLEAAGLVVSKVGSGTTVAGGVSPLARRERLRLLNEGMDSLLAQASHLGFSQEELIELLRRRKGRFGEEMKDVSDD